MLFMQEIVKMDFKTKTSLVWTEEGCSASEPVFVGRPEATEEDEGCLCCIIIHNICISLF